MSVETLPDVEGAVRGFLRADAGVAALVGTRVFFGVPRNSPSFPLITVARVGGGDDESEAPIDRAGLRINVWGAFTADGSPNKAGCFAVMNAVRAAFYGLRGRTTVASVGVDLFGASVNTVLWAPDPGDDRPRYTLTVLVTAIST